VGGAQSRRVAVLSDPFPNVAAVGSKTEEGVVLIDCDTCQVRGVGCGDCVVSVLLGAPPDGVQFDPAEREALAVLARCGLVPPLRLAPPADTSATG